MTLPSHLLVSSFCHKYNPPTQASALASAWRRTWITFFLQILKTTEDFRPWVWVALLLLLFLHCLSSPSTTRVCWSITLLLRLWTPHWLWFRLRLEKAKEPSVHSVFAFLRHWGGVWWDLWWGAGRWGRRVSEIDLWLSSSQEESKKEKELHLACGWGGLLRGALAPTHWGAELVFPMGFNWARP